ncbi:hypothetical protein BJ742DRAFT_188937 [Cladochytrium replicatum]|nr:hypothetical protein BJ742DRAFT_188937 [Cladochytrium replicatum]
MMHVECCIGNIFPSSKTRDLVRSSGHISLRKIDCEVISAHWLVASVTLWSTYRGKRVMDQVTYTRNWHYFKLLFFVLLGVFGVSSVLYLFA